LTKRLFFTRRFNRRWTY